MSSPANIDTLATEGAKNIQNGLPLKNNQINALLQKFESGDYFAHINFGIESGRLMPYKLVESIRGNNVRTETFILLLGYLFRKGLDPNHYIDLSGLGMRVHILVYIHSNLQASDSFKYMADLFKDAGCSFYLQGYEGANNKNTVKDLISYTETNLDADKYSLNSMLGVRGVSPDITITWADFKSILLDRSPENLSQDGDFLNFLEDTSQYTNKFLMRSVVMYLCVYCNSENALRKSRDDELFLNSIGNMCQSAYMAINAQNLQMFRIVMDKGAECNYICMTELIVRHNIAVERKDDILAKVYGDMIDYAILTGSEMDEYQLKLLSLQGSAELIERIKTNYEETEWNKSCNIVKNGGGSKFSTLKLRQMAFNLNIDFELPPEKICEKLNMIANMDRVEFVKESIVRQEERLRKDLIDKGEISGQEGLARTRCNARSRIINNPYAYNDARMASYFDQKDGELYCFTADLFEGLVNTRKNPYNNQPLPTVFIETLKAQLNILKYLRLSRPKDNIKIGDAMKEIFDERKAIDNKIGEEIYYDGLVLYRLYTAREEAEYRTKCSSDFARVCRKFIETSFLYCVDTNYLIHSDFLKGDIKTDNNIIGSSAIYDSVSSNVSGPANIFKYTTVSTNSLAFNLKIEKMFTDSKYITRIPNTGFNEILYRIVSEHIKTLNDFYSNGRTVGQRNNPPAPFYRDKTANMKVMLDYFII